jgi:hypothetical protein
MFQALHCSQTSVSLKSKQCCNTSLQRWVKIKAPFFISFVTFFVNFIEDNKYENIWWILLHNFSLNKISIQAPLEPQKYAIISRISALHGRMRQSYWPMLQIT